MDLVRMSPEDHEAARDRFKVENTKMIMELIESLKPYIDGSLGPVSPNHANSYLKAVREVGLIWDVYARPVKAEEVKGPDQEAMVLAARQEAVLAELAKLREVGMKRRPPS